MGCGSTTRLPAPSTRQPHSVHRWKAAHETMPSVCPLRCVCCYRGNNLAEEVIVNEGGSPESVGQMQCLVVASSVPNYTALRHKFAEVCLPSQTKHRHGTIGPYSHPCLSKRLQGARAAGSQRLSKPRVFIHCIRVRWPIIFQDKD